MKQHWKLWQTIHPFAAGVSHAVHAPFKEANARLRDVLLKRSYQISYDEVNGAEHEFIHWRNKFADGLIYLTSQ